MIDPKSRHKIEQGSALIVETWPPLLWGFYHGCLEQGFPDSHALFLAAEFMKVSISQNRPGGSDGD